MRKYLKFSFFILGILLITCCQQEDDELVVAGDEECLIEVNGNYEIGSLDQEPTYIDGGKDSLYIRVLREIKYPPEARENGIEGESIIRYDITVEGEIADLEVIQNPGGGIGEETKRAFELPTTGVSFNPGILNGEAVRVRKTFKAIFRLEG